MSSIYFSQEIFCRNTCFFMTAFISKLWANWTIILICKNQTSMFLQNCASLILHCHAVYSFRHSQWIQDPQKVLMFLNTCCKHTSFCHILDYLAFNCNSSALVLLFWRWQENNLTASCKIIQWIVLHICGMHMMHASPDLPLVSRSCTNAFFCQCLQGFA